MLNTNEILTKIKADYNYFSNVRKELREDKDFCLLAIKANPYCYLVNSFKFKTDIDVIRYILNTGNIDIIKVLKFDKELLETEQEYKNLYLLCVEFKKKYGYSKLYGAIFNVNSDEVYKYVNGEFMARNSVILRTLTEEEEQVLKMRYGLSDGNFKTLEEIGNNFNITRERVRQIEAKAMRKLWHPSRRDLILFSAAKSGIPSAVESLKGMNILEIKPNAETNTNVKIGTNMPLDSLGLSVRTYNCLMRAGFTTLDSILNLSEEELLSIRNFNKKAVDEVISLQKMYSIENSEEKGKNK